MSILENYKDKWTEKSGCLLWHGANNGKGYPIVTVWENGAYKNRYVHRLVCEENHGPPPTPKHQAAHSPCNARNCVTPAHLRWATPSENEFDKPVGVRKRSAKLASDVAHQKHLEQL